MSLSSERGVSMATPRKTWAERREELRQVAGSPKGFDKLFLILANYVPSGQVPVSAFMIEAILSHEYTVQA